MIRITQEDAYKIISYSKPIKGFSKYYIADDGTVLSMLRPFSPKILSGTIDNPNKNHRVIMKSDRGKQCVRSVHRLVAEAFIPNPNKFPDVIHKDGDKFNNSVDNLEWCDINSKNFNKAIINNDYEWFPIKDFPGYYICKEGKVLSIHGLKEKILNTSTDKYGYSILSLSQNGKSKMIYLHRLVAETFIPNPNNYSVVIHKDDNNANNAVDNLRWGTRFDIKRKLPKEQKFYNDKNHVIVVMGKRYKKVFNTADEVCDILNLNKTEVIKAIKKIIKDVNGYRIFELTKEEYEELKTWSHWS